MRADLDAILCSAAPNLFRERSQGQSCMGQGFACGDGWFSLLLEAATDLEALALDLRAVQVKEKFGTLAFYIRGADSSDSRVTAIIDRAERRSSSECDVCGAAGMLRRDSYRRVLCDQHAKP